MTAEASARGRSNRRAGHDAERRVVRYLQEAGFADAVTTRNTGGAGGRQLGDVSFTPGVVLEVKHVQSGTAWPTWLRQAEAEAGPDRIAAVVRRTPGVPDVGRWVTVARYAPALLDALTALDVWTQPDRSSLCRYERRLQDIEVRSLGQRISVPGERRLVLHQPVGFTSPLYLACRFSTFIAALKDEPVA